MKPPIDRVTVMLALLGVFIALWRWREPLYALSLVSLPVMALGSILTFDGIYRRTFGIVPFIMLLAGSVLGVLWERADRLSLPVRVPALALLGLLVALIVYRNVDLYFGTFEESRLHREVYYPDITFLSERLAELPDGTYLYFFSLRAQRGHEIRRFLAPKLDEGEDRSREFGKFSVDVGHDPPLVFAFMDAYLETLPRVIARYPGGQVSERRDRGGLLYRTYYFPQGSSIDGDGDIAGPMRAMRPSTDAPPPGASAPPSCVHHERRPDSMTYFRYAPSSNSYAVFRKRASSSGDAIVIWRQDAAGWRELGCAATGTLAAPGRVADMAELGLTADAGTVYYVGAAHVPTSGSIVTPEVSVWERKR